MLLKNLSPSSGLVNGSRGIVVGFQKATGSPFSVFPIVKFQTFVGHKKLDIEYEVKDATWSIMEGDRYKNDIN